MKKIISLLASLALLSACLLSCGKTETEPEGNDEYKAAVALFEEGEYGKAKAAFYRLGDYLDSVKYYGSILEYPTVVTLTDETHDKAPCETREFDENGNTTKTVNDDSTVEYYFNDAGVFIKEVTKDTQSGEVFRTVEYTLGDDGNAVSAVCTFADEENNREYAYTYDEHGNRTSNTVTDSEGSDTTVMEYKYDEDGNILTDKWIYSDGSWDATDYTYNDKGLVITEVSYNQDGETGGAEHEYDIFGNQTKWTYRGYRNFTFIYTYDEDGNMAKAEYIPADPETDGTAYINEYSGFIYFLQSE